MNRFNMTCLKYMIVAVILILLQLGSTHSREILEDWSSFAVSGSSKELVRWLKDEAINFLAGKEHRAIITECPSFYGRFGIFITLIKEKKVRGCFGAFAHSSENIESVLREYLKGALRQDHRYKPLEIVELSDTDIIVTITSQPYQVVFSDLDTLDISRYGIMTDFENGGRAIFVPAEIKTHSYMRKLIGPRRIASASAFRAVTIR